MSEQEIEETFKELEKIRENEHWRVKRRRKNNPQWLR
jgi:hypothetical protein